MKEQYVLLAIHVHRKKNFSFVWKKSHFLCSEIRKKKKKRTNEQTNLWCVYFGRSFRRFFCLSPLPPPPPPPVAAAALLNSNDLNLSLLAV